MTGKSDLAARGEARLAERYHALDAQLDRLFDALANTELEKASTLDIQRFARAVELAARAARATAMLARQLGRSGRDGAEQAEDDMADDDFDDSPEALDRLRDQLERRVGELDRAFERKGLAFQPGRWPVARAGGEPAGAATAPDPGG